MTFKITNTTIPSVLLRCLVLAATVTFHVTGQTHGAQAEVDKIQFLAGAARLAALKNLRGGVVL
jgi:hypothetical protein